MSKLIAQDNNQNKQFKPKIYQISWRGQLRNYYDWNNSGQSNYQNRDRSKSGDRKTSFRCSGQYRQNYRGRPWYVNNYRNDFRRDNFRETQNNRSQTFRGGYRRNYRNDNFGRGRSRSREIPYSGNFNRNDRSNSRSRSNLRASINRDRIRCFKCRKYDLFANDCQNLQTEKEPEQMQQMYNLDEDQTALTALATDT